MKFLNFLVFICACSASAQLSKVEIQASKNHPRVLAAIRNWERLRSEGEKAKSAFRPTLSFSGVGAFGDDASIFASPMEPRNYLFAPQDPIAMGSLMAMVPIFTAGRNAAAASYARFLSTAGAAEVEIARQDVLRDVRVAFAELDAARDRLAARTAGYNAADELLNVTDARFQAGSAPEAFLLKAKANLSRAARMRTMAEADVSVAAAELAEAAGGSPLQGEWDIELSAPQSLDEAINASEARAELRALRARASAERSTARIAARSSYPELNAVAMGTGMATDDESELLYKLGLVLSFPIFDGGLRRAEAAEARAMAASTDEDLKAQNLRIKKEVTSAWARWEASPTVVEAAESEVASAQEAYRIALLRYQEGKAPQVEVEQAAADLVEALAGRSEANAFRRTAWANLMRAVGKNNQEDQ